jgi:hypothetical protein
MPPDSSPEGARPGGNGYWFTPVPVYLLDAVYDPDSPVNAPAAMLWAHIHRHYAWRERVFPSYARLAEETRQSESAVKRQLNALKAAGAITWGATYRARGRSSNEYALAVLEPFRFDRETPRPVQVKNDPHCPVQVKNEPSVEFENEPHPQFENDLGVESSSYLENTDEFLSPRLLPAQRSESGPVDEREKPSPFNNPQQPPDTDAAAQVTASWADAYKRSSSGSAPSTKAVARVRASATSRLRAGKTADELTAIAADMAQTNLAWTDLAEHEAHWLHKQHTLVGAGADGGMWDRALARAQARGGPSTTDARVQAALDLGRQMQAEHDAANRGHQPHRDTYRDHLDHLGRQAAAGARPYGWDQVPHCGHLDCDSVTRYRETEDADGLRSLSACPDCHPSLRF